MLQVAVCVLIDADVLLRQGQDCVHRLRAAQLGDHRSQLALDHSVAQCGRARVQLAFQLRALLGHLLLDARPPVLDLLRSLQLAGLELLQRLTRSCSLRRVQALERLCAGLGLGAGVALLLERTLQALHILNRPAVSQRLHDELLARLLGSGTKALG